MTMVLLYLSIIHSCHFVVNAKTVSGSKRRQPSSSSAAPRAKKRRRAHQDEDSSQSGDENESGEVILHTCACSIKLAQPDTTPVAPCMGYGDIGIPQLCSFYSCQFKVIFLLKGIFLDIN